MSFMAQHTLLVLVGVTFAALSSCSAQAHNAGMSTSRIVIHGRTLDVEINALGRDYERATVSASPRQRLGSLTRWLCR